MVVTEYYYSTWDLFEDMGGIFSSFKFVLGLSTTFFVIWYMNDLARMIQRKDRFKLTQWQIKRELEAVPMLVWAVKAARGQSSKDGEQERAEHAVALQEIEEIQALPQSTQKKSDIKLERLKKILKKYAIKPVPQSEAHLRIRELYESRIQRPILAIAKELGLRLSLYGIASAGSKQEKSDIRIKALNK